MTVENPPGVLNAISTDGKIQRHTAQAQAGAPVGSFTGGVSAVGMAHGICYPAALAVTQQGSPTMGVTVAAGTGLITGTVSAEQGSYSFYNNAAQNLTIAAAHATLTRFDLVIAQVRDAAYSGAISDARLTVVTGTAAGSPADPSLASFPNALVLARVTVAGAATSITNAAITDLRLGARASDWYQSWGEVAYKEITAATAPIGTGPTTVPGLHAVEWTPVVGRLYKATYGALLLPSAASSLIRLLLTDRNASNAVFQRAAFTSANTGAFTVERSRRFTGLTTTTSLDVQLQCSSGTCVVDGNTNHPAFCLVEDIGPA